MARAERCSICGLPDTDFVEVGQPNCIISGGDRCVRRGYQRLGELLEAKDAELAAAKARIAELEAKIEADGAWEAELAMRSMSDG